MIRIILLRLILIVIIFIGTGCVESTATFTWKVYGRIQHLLLPADSNETDPNIVEPNWADYADTDEIKFTGKASEIVAERLAENWAANIRTVQGREDALFETLKQAALPLLAVFVGGLIFWGWSRSKWAWIIPASALAGLVVIYYFAGTVKYVKWIVPAVAFLIVMWRAHSYQKERNDAEKKVKELQK